MITPGDIDDRKPLEYKAFVDFIYGKLVGDKGYISKNLFNRLFVDGIQLITKPSSNSRYFMWCKVNHKFTNDKGNGVNNAKILIKLLLEYAENLNMRNQIYAENLKICLSNLFPSSRID